MWKKVKKRFKEVFGGEEGATLMRAPGRINLIGGHTDYQGGYVLPVAVDRFIWSYGRKRSYCFCEEEKTFYL